MLLAQKHVQIHVPTHLMLTFVALASFDCFATQHLLSSANMLTVQESVRSNMESMSNRFNITGQREDKSNCLITMIGRAVEFQYY